MFLSIKYILIFRLSLLPVKKWRHICNFLKVYFTFILTNFQFLQFVFFYENKSNIQKFNANFLSYKKFGQRVMPVGV